MVIRAWLLVVSVVAGLCGSLVVAPEVSGEESYHSRHWLWSTAHRIPKEYMSEESGYFSIVEGKNGKIYVGTAKYGSNAYLVEFDPTAEKAAEAMKMVVDCQKEIGTSPTGFAAQAKIHTRNNVGKSGKIYFGTKQGYPQKGESRDSYLGGYPMVYDPATGKTRTYEIPIKHQGIISVTPDESRGIAYVSTCSDERPIESTHFMVLNLETGEYTDLMDCRHMYAFIVVDAKGRAYHPILGGDIARYNPDSKKLDRLKQTIDGKPPTEESLLAHPKSHPINWDITPDRKTMYSVAMSGNQLFSYDLTQNGNTLAGKSHGPLIAAAKKTDCRAMCVGPDGTVWAGVAATFDKPGKVLHLVRYRPGKDKAPVDLGPIAIGNPDYTTFTDKDGKQPKWHHGVYQLKDGTSLPRYVIMGICAASDDTVYVTTLYPFTLHAIRIPKVAGVTTTYYHNSHADVLLTRLLETDQLNGSGQRASLELKSLWMDQIAKRGDIGRQWSRKHGFPIYPKISETLKAGQEKLSVDGVMMIAEHGDYPESDLGQIMYPKRRLFSQIIEEFDRSGKVVPVFSDKHLSDNWTNAKWIYDAAKERNVPMMAGSSIPVLWRYPPLDLTRDAKVKQIVATSYHRLDTYGFHALEMVQCLAERRQGGETGVRSVQCLTGQAVWDAEKTGLYDPKLLDAAIARLKRQPRKGKTLQELVREPALFVVNYEDGLRICVFTLNGAVAEWASAWREEGDPEIKSTLFWTQEERPYHHFNALLQGIEKMMHTGKPTWPVERTLMTTGVLDALHISKKQGGKLLPTPWLKDVEYQSDWNWQQPPEPPPGRPYLDQ